MDVETRIVLICVVMLLFGCAYGIIIAVQSFRPGLTWLSVAIGDGVTDLGSWAVLLLLTGSFWLALVPVGMHLLTGTPMITGQLLKHRLQNGGHVVIDDSELD
jgi:hypothetical protein